MTSPTSESLSNSEEWRQTPGYLYKWRNAPGYLYKGYSNFEATHILLGKFLRDRHSPSPISEKSLLSDNSDFAWDNGPPLEKVVDTVTEFEHLALRPALFRNSVSIVEPWEHVGMNALGEKVRASVNAAYILQRIADCDSILYPMWKAEVADVERFVSLMMSGLAVIVEGGNGSSRDPSTYADDPDVGCSLEYMQSVIDTLLLSRSPSSAPVVFICVGHQMAANSHIRLLRRAVSEVLATNHIEDDHDGSALEALTRACHSIQEIGHFQKVRRDGVQLVANNWEHPDFAVSQIGEAEVGPTVLLHYQTPDPRAALHIPIELIRTHEVTADEFEGVIDTSIEYEHEVTISMFHSDEVNEEAILFANWAYRLLREAITPHRHIVAGSHLCWLLQLPYAIEILASTGRSRDNIITECAATCILYKDFETKGIRRSFTCQFHPELLSDLRQVGHRPAPSYAELKNDDGARLFARLLYAGMQE